MIRFKTGDHGTFGKIYLPQKTFFTGELPDRNNEKNISCILTGIYSCVWTYSPRFNCFMYLIENDFRTGLRFHSANFMGDKKKGLLSQLNGCISLGEKYGKINGQQCILISRPAIRYFENYMNKKPFTLEIKQCY